LTYRHGVPAQKLLTTAQLARELGVSPRTIVRWADRGWIYAAETFPSGHRRWSLEDVRHQLASARERQ
jgi:excisionase family DNA binding protein